MKGRLLVVVVRCWNRVFVSENFRLWGRKREVGKAHYYTNVKHYYTYVEKWGPSETVRKPWMLQRLATAGRTGRGAHSQRLRLCRFVLHAALDCAGRCRKFGLPG